MNEKEKDNLLKDAVAAIGVIKAQYDGEVIKDYEIPPLVNMNTGEDIGFGVKLQLNTRYDYDEELLTEWKRLLKADDWHISVKRNQLHVTFKVRYKKDNHMTDEQMKAMSKADANASLSRIDMHRWVQLHNATANCYFVKNGKIEDVEPSAGGTNAKKPRVPKHSVFLSPR